MPTPVQSHSPQLPSFTAASTVEDRPGPELFDARISDSHKPNSQPNDNPAHIQQRYQDLVGLLRQAEQQLHSMGMQRPDAPENPAIINLRGDARGSAPSSVVGNGVTQNYAASLVSGDVGYSAKTPIKQSTSKSSIVPAAPGLWGWLLSGLAPDAKIANPGAGPTRSPQPQSTAGISNMQYLVTGGCIFMALALMVDVPGFTVKATPSNICQDVVRPDAVLSRDQLTQILSVSERTPRNNVQQVIAQPYCRMAPVTIRAGVMAEREAYPLEFDPDTWLVLLYEGEEYAGFDFSFQR